MNENGIFQLIHCEVALHSANQLFCYLPLQCSFHCLGSPSKSSNIFYIFPFIFNIGLFIVNILEKFLENLL